MQQYKFDKTLSYTKTLRIYSTAAKSAAKIGKICSDNSFCMRTWALCLRCALNGRRHNTDYKSYGSLQFCAHAHGIGERDWCGYWLIFLAHISRHASAPFTMCFLSLCRSASTLSVCININWRSAKKNALARLRLSFSTAALRCYCAAALSEFTQFSRSFTTLFVQLLSFVYASVRNCSYMAHGTVYSVG